MDKYPANTPKKPFKDVYPKSDVSKDMNPQKERRELPAGDAGDDAKDD